MFGLRYDDKRIKTEHFFCPHYRVKLANGATFNVPTITLGCRMGIVRLGEFNAALCLSVCLQLI